MSAINRNLQGTSSSSENFWLQVYFALPAIMSVVSIVLVFGAPSEGDSAILFGLSLARWFLVLILLLLLVVFASLAWQCFKNKQWWDVARKKVLVLLDNRAIYFVLVILSLLIGLATFYIVLLTFKFTDQFIQARLVRLLPLSVWLFAFGLQNIVILPQLRPCEKPISRISQLAQWKPALIALGSLLVVAIFVSTTGVGLKPDRVGWDNPGVPLLGTQIVLAWFLGILIYGLMVLAEKRYGWKMSHIDKVAAIIIWFAAVWSWQSQPLTPTFFSPTPRAPNFEYYPYSDAATHDVGAQSLIAGSGFPDVIEKPFYSFFLSILHTIAGQDYSKVVNFQILILALFPVVLYFIGAKFHYRLSGAMLAFAIIFREANSIALSGEIRVSHSKLLMTDLPTALAIAAFTLLLLRWMQSAKTDMKWNLLVGGAMGFLALLRSQVIIFAPLLLILTFWQAEPSWRWRIRKATILALGLVLALSPWLFRNYLINGQFGYSQPLQAAYLAKQYSLAPETATFDVPEGTPVSKYASLGYSKVIQFSLSHPAEVASFISAHSLHNEVSSFLALPMRFDFVDKLVIFYNLQPYWIGLEDKLWNECCSLDAYVADTPYWQTWDGKFPSAALPIIVGFAFISIGVGAAWKKLGWLTLVPIGIHIFYNLSTAVARVSGWRLSLPVDWVLLMFYCVGIGQVSLWVWGYITRSQSNEISDPTNHINQPKTNWRWQRLVPLGVAILFTGMLLPLSEILIPERYEVVNAESAQHLWDASDLSENVNLDITNFLSQPNAEILTGRVLYPRFYLANEGEPGGTGIPFNPLPFPRIAFWLVGAEGGQVALPLEASTVFPNATDALVIGCHEETFLRADAVLFTDETKDLLGNSPNLFECK